MIKAYEHKMIKVQYRLETYQCLFILKLYRESLILSFAIQAKTTKKLVLRLECGTCKHRIQVPIKRTKHFELGGDKKRKGQMIQF